MINSDYELGYTPSNLRKVIKDSGLSFKDVAKIIGVSVPSLDRYVADPTAANFVSMNHKHWIKLLEHIK